MVLPEIRLLQAAIVLAEELNFSRAAERLRIDQSTLSRRIMELEAMVGLRLFERNHQTCRVDRTRPPFCAGSPPCLAARRTRGIDATAASRGADEVLNFGKSAYTDPFLVTTLLSVQLPLYPGLKIKQWSNYSHELAHQVAVGKLDMALVTAVPDTPKLSLLMVADAPLYIALSRDHPAERQKRASTRGFSAHDWILPAPHVNPHFHE